MSDDKDDDGTFEGWLETHEHLLENKEFVDQMREDFKKAIREGDPDAQSCLDYFNYYVAECNQRREREKIGLFDNDRPPALKIVKK